MCLTVLLTMSQLWLAAELPIYVCHMCEYLYPAINRLLSLIMQAYRHDVTFSLMMYVTP